MHTTNQWGITPSDFLTREGRALYDVIQGYYNNFATSGSVIGQYALQQSFPNFPLYDDPSMTTEALCYEVRKVRLTVEFKQRTQKALEKADYDIGGAINALHAHALELQTIGFSKQTDVPFDESFSRTMRKMEMIEQGIDTSCGKWPWSPLQDATGGLQPDDFAIIYGRPKNMKTWVMAFLVAWFHDMGKRVLIYTKEMTADNIWQRAGACLAQVRYNEFRVAPWMLTWIEKQSLYAVERLLHYAQLEQAAICLSAKDATEGGDTVPWLQAKVELYKPDVVFVDGMYLMSDVKGNKKSNEKVGSISNDLRAMNLRTGIPVIATIQANREAAKNQEANLDELAFSDRVGQDATLLMRAINEKNSPTVALVMGGATREYQLDGFRIFGVPATNFDYHSEITDKEIEKAKEQDTSGNESGNSKNTPKQKEDGSRKKLKGVSEKEASKTVMKQLDAAL